MLNKVVVMGRLTADPTLTTLANGTTLTRFRIAVKRDGQQTTDFFSVCAWNNTARFITEHFKKSQRIIVDGHLTSYDLPTTQVSAAKHTIVEIAVEKVLFGDYTRSPAKENTSDSAE